MNIKDIENSNNLLVVVDMINGFINEGALSDNYINRIVPNNIALIEHFREKKADIIAFKDCHNKNSQEFKAYPAHCLKETSESELIPELKVFEKDMTVIEKNSTNGFLVKEFQDLIKDKKYENVVICGCCSDICVLQFALTYKCYLNQHDLDTNVIIYQDAIETFDAINHDRDVYNKMAIDLMRNAAIEIR